MDLTLCLTHDCNMRCVYCYAGRKRPDSMPWDVARQAIDLAVEESLRAAPSSGKQPAMQIGFFGGEPLLEWPILVKASEYAAASTSRRGIALKKTLTTNMTLLNDEKARWLKDNLFYLGLSLDGNAAMHDTLRVFADGSASHARCAQALDFFRGLDARAEVIIVVDPRNVHHLSDSVGWLFDSNMRNLSLNPNFSIEWPDQAIASLRKEYGRIADSYIERYRHDCPVRINMIDGKIRVRIKDGYDDLDKCGFGRNEMAVAPAGNIYPCERVVGDDSSVELRIGDVLTGFDEARRREIIACRGCTVPECAGCDLADRCMNWCSCINHATTGSINRVAGIVCTHERIAIEAADRVGATLFAESNPAFLAKFYRH